MPDGDVAALAAAIDAASSNAEADVVHLAPAGTYVLVELDNEFYGRNGLPVLSGELNIDGNGARIIRSADASGFRILVVASDARVTIEDVELTGGTVTSEPYDRGGAILLEGGALTVVRCTLRENLAGGEGGAIFNSGGELIIEDSVIEINTTNGEGGGVHNAPNAMLTMTRSRVSGNNANRGGGVYNAAAGAATILECAFDANTERGGCGAAIHNRGVMEISLSTIAGNTANGSAGGGICNDGGQLTVRDSMISQNTSRVQAGGVFSAGAGSLTMIDVQVVGNSAFTAGFRGGGGIAIHGTASLLRCSLVDNYAENFGGGVYLDEGSLTMTACLVSGNTGYRGGGIFAYSGSIHLANTTISANQATVSAGGVWSRSAAWIGACTIAGNAAQEEAGGVLTLAEMTMTNTIVADSGGAPEIFGQYTDGGHNIVEDGSGITDPTSIAGDPALAPLADNGGPTMTHAIGPESIATDSGDCAGGSISEDQRGTPRPQGLACDIGAFELEDACVADFNGDGTVDSRDVIAFLNAWADDDAGSDIDGNGLIDTRDVLAFLGLWNAGC